MSAKNKLQRFADNEVFPNVIQPQFEEIFHKEYKLKNQWKSEYWHNTNPIVLELGCGKGEYTVALAQANPEKNYIGIDIKGARFWRGAKTALDNDVKNAAFLRTRIEFIDSFFGANEVDEIWITFPDPQLRKKCAKKRLTSSRFLNMYRAMLQPNAVVNLKTDSKELYNYTKTLLEQNKQEILVATDDLYNSGMCDEILSIKTQYESFYLAQGKPITYLKFRLSGVIEPLLEPEKNI